MTSDGIAPIFFGHGKRHCDTIRKSQSREFVQRRDQSRRYQISGGASDTEQAKTAVARIFCPDPDHAPPCPVPWESKQHRRQGFSEVQLFESAGDNDQSIDGSTVIEQFHIEKDLPESESGGICPLR